MFHRPSLFKPVVNSWMSKNIPQRAAALAYYAIISLAPLIILLVSLLKPLLNDIQTQILYQMNYFMGPVGYTVVSQILEHIEDSHKTGIAVVAGFFFLFLGINGVFSELHDSCDHIWGLPPRFSGIHGFFHKRLLSLIMLAVAAVFLIILVVISSVLPAISPIITGGTQVLVHAFDLSLSILIFSVVFSFAFRFIPNVKVAWRDVFPGAIGTACLFTVGKSVLGFYFAKFSTTSAYGVAGSFVAFLVWVYYSSQIFFLGIEYTRAYAYQFGSLKKDPWKKD